MQNRRKFHRLLAMVIDHGIICFILVGVSAFDAQAYIRTESNVFSWNWYQSLVVSLYFFKDTYQGRSPGKHFMNLQVVSASSELAATPIQCFVRNITAIIWPIEVIATYLNPEKRIGDYLAGTRVVSYDPERTIQPVNATQVIIAILISICYAMLLGYFINLVMQSMIR